MNIHPGNEMSIILIRRIHVNKRLKRSYNTSCQNQKTLQLDNMGTHTKGLQSYWFSVLKFILVFYLIPVKCASYCYYYYSYLYSGYRLTCYYYYYYYYYSSYSSSISTGGIVGIVIGGVVGFIIFVSCVIVVCVQVICKSKNHGRVVVNPQQPNINYINTTHSTQGGLNPLYYNSQYPPPPPAYHPPVLPPPAPMFPDQANSQIPEQAALPS